MMIQRFGAGVLTCVCMLLFSACGSDSDNGFRALQATSQIPPASTMPYILDLSLSPSSALEMNGGGTVSVTATLDFGDAGRDVSDVKVAISGGTELSFPYDELMVETEATMLCDFDISTVQAGSYEVEIWLVDKEGATSNHMTANFVVFVQVSGDWTGRLTGLPFILNDVLWDGDIFIAVGDSGAILTSADGLAWAEQDSGTSANLHAVASRGANIVVVGSDATVLLSSDNGKSWSIKHSGPRARLPAVAISPSQIVAGGMDKETGDAFIMRSEDLGDSWVVVQPLPQSEHCPIDLVYANGLFVAATGAFDPESDARVMVSVDGEIWQEVILRDESAAPYAILHDGTQFIAAGSHPSVFASADGYFWRELPTPIEDVSYLSATWTGSKLVAAGGITWWYWWGGSQPSFERDAGLSSSDGGSTWEVFNIDGYYESRGMAWGSGRLVSVGQSTPISGEGAIYTSP
jgi:photosystem II stability/assembly factor-like uncharacterized protein